MKTEEFNRDDEQVIKDFVYSQIQPIMEISKNNMLTNAYKNQELCQAKLDMNDLHKRVSQFGT